MFWRMNWFPPRPPSPVMWRVGADYTFRGSISGRGEVFRTRSDRSQGSPSPLYYWNRVFAGVKRPGRGFNTHPHLALRLKDQLTYTSTGVLISPQPDQEVNKLQRPKSNFCKPLKKKSECCPSNLVSAAAMTSASDEKWRPFNCFFRRVRLRTYQHPCALHPALCLGRRLQCELTLSVMWILFESKSVD